MARTLFVRRPSTYPTDWEVYVIRNLVTQRDALADVTHLKPFFYDPDFVTPLNVAVRDTDEFVVEAIVAHQLSRTKDVSKSLWQVRWKDYTPDDDTWEPYTNVKDVEAFHNYCRDQGLFEYLPAYLKDMSNLDGAAV